jgi:MFS family permease
VSRKRLLWIGAAAILVVAALVALVAIVRGRLSDTDGRILMSLAVLLFSGGTALAGLAVVDRGRLVALGWATAVGAGVGLVLELWGVWSFVFDGGSETPSKVAWSAALVVVALLIAATGQLLARARRLAALAGAAGGLAGVAAVLSVVGVWTEPNGNALVKLLAALWILAVLGFFLVPVLQRSTSVGAPAGVRVLAVLGDVELVAGRAPLDGVEVIEAPRAGERLALRRRQPGT